MKITIEANPDEKYETGDIRDWIREGEFDSDIDIEVKIHD
jgi:hypothetical protein